MGQTVTLALVGSGGDGVILLGELLAATAAGAGLHCFLTKSFGPQIRGGETSCTLTVSDHPLHCPAEQADVLAVLDSDALAHFASELRCISTVVVLSDERQPPPSLPCPSGSVQLLPLGHLAMQCAGSKLARNMVLGGALCSVLSWPATALAGQVEKRLARRGAEEVQRNTEALLAGYALSVPLVNAPPVTSVEMPLLLETGNQALVRGAIAAGCRYFAGYPISPATEILKQIIAELPEHGGTAVQAEDEIAAIGMALGAAAGGVRAMTATSGPGFSLMAETLGLAVVTELPLVVVDVQRVGPSTGIPSRTEQADLNMALYGRHGDAPLPVLAPTSISDCSELTLQAFDIAQQCQTPVILLSDQYLAQSVQSIGSQPDTQPATVSAPKSVVSSLTGLVHEASGEPSSDPHVHAAASYARRQKLDALQPLVRAATYTPRPASPFELGILTWGSSFGPACAAADSLSALGHSVTVLAPRLLFPLQHELIGYWLKSVARVMVAELNHSGQFMRYLRSEFDFRGKPVNSHNLAGGAPLVPSFLVAEIEPLLSK